MDTIITNFFSEGICRLIPGIILIALYGRHSLTHDSGAFPGPAASLAVCMLLIAWVIGATLDVVFFGLGYFVLNRPVLQKCKWVKRGHDWIEFIWQEKNSGAQKPSAPTETEHQKYERLQGIRRNAERVLFRSMAIISIAAAIRPPTIFSDDWVTRLCSIVAFLAFSGCWYWYTWAKKEEFKPEKGSN